ncbi:MAG: hypothetical protein QNJ72_30160 [Pleurocapsa sp. MO_226.B13]|nr:hypothetical protein [Pleurocapsa sp. MO_226.B13]
MIDHIYQSKNHNVIQFFGLRKSGNHAIISWILDHHNGITVHLNDVSNYHPNPYFSFGQVNVCGLPFWRCKPQILSYLKYGFRKDKTYSFVRWDSSVNLSYIQSSSPKQLVIVSYEDDHPKDEFLSQLSTKCDKFLGTTEHFYKIILMRDPFNLFASLIKSNLVDEDTIDHYIRLYKDYAGLVLEQQTQSSTNNQNLPNEFIFISYNRWFLDSKYRQSIAEQLGFITDGETYNKVPKQGGGSTFDGLKLDGKAQDLKVLERWQSMMDHPLFQKILQDRELCEYSQQIFGDILHPRQLKESLEATS